MKIFHTFQDSIGNNHRGVILRSLCQYLNNSYLPYTFLISLTSAAAFTNTLVGGVYKFINNRGWKPLLHNVRGAMNLATTNGNIWSSRL